MNISLTSHVRNRTRMVEWLLLAALFYLLSMYARMAFPGITEDKLHLIETLFWKLGNAVSGAFLGYWADRTLIGRILRTDGDLRKLARAIVVVGVIIGISGGV